MFSVRFRLAGVISVYLALISAGLILSRRTSAHAQRQKTVAVSFAMDSRSVVLHQPVIIDFSVRNELSEEVAFDLGPDREGNFEFLVVQPDASRVRVSPLRHGGMSLLGKIYLPAGEVYRQELLLNQWYPFSKSGNYKVRATLVTTIRAGPGAPLGGPVSQELSLEVGPPDPKRLVNVCQSLAQEATSPGTESALFAARALSYVQDLIAVPYLARLTREGPFVVVTKSIALQGLARIADAEGLERVTAHLSAEDRKLQPLIRSEVTAIRSGAQVLD